MTDIKRNLNELNEGSFEAWEGGTLIGEMVVAIKGNVMTIYHTGIKPEYEGMGYAKQLLDYVAGYAREQHLKIEPLCPYVRFQFARHPEVYGDLV